MNNKKRIDIPVTPFVYAIMSGMHGNNDIIVDQKQNKKIAFLCQCAPVSAPQERIKLLTKSLTLYLTPSLYSGIIKQNLHAIGLLWHRHFLNTMYEFIDAQVLANENAYPAMERYLDEHNVSEDDWSRETAYRAWQTYKKKKNKLKYGENHKIVRNRQRFNVTAECVRFQERNQHARLKPAGIERSIYAFLKIDKTVFDKSRRTRIDIEHRRAICFVYNRICGMSLGEIAHRVKLAKSTIQRLLPPKVNYSDYDVTRKTVRHILKKLESTPLSVLKKSQRA